MNNNKKENMDMDMNIEHGHQNNREHVHQKPSSVTCCCIRTTIENKLRESYIVHKINNSYFIMN